jgi:hypothetical protein
MWPCRYVEMGPGSGRGGRSRVVSIFPSSFVFLRACFLALWLYPLDSFFPKHFLSDFILFASSLSSHLVSLSFVRLYIPVSFTNSPSSCCLSSYHALSLRISLSVSFQPIGYTRVSSNLKSQPRARPTCLTVLRRGELASNVTRSSHHSLLPSLVLLAVYPRRKVTSADCEACLVEGVFSTMTLFSP